MRSSLPGFERTAALFWGLGSGNWRESVRDSMKESPWCCCVREKREAGCAAGVPPRRRGGGGAGASGRGGTRGTAGGSSARQQEGEEERRDAWGPARRKKAAGKPLHGAGVGAVGGRRREQSGEVEVEEKGDFAISKNSRDCYVNQR